MNNPARPPDSGAYIQDLELQVQEMCNFMWGLMYPDDPNGWEYRTQPMAHLRAYIAELKSAAEQFRQLAQATPNMLIWAENEVLKLQIEALQEELGKVKQHANR